MATKLAVKCIRPWQVFTLLKPAGPPAHVVSAVMPSRRPVAGTTLLEAFVMIAAIRAIEAHQVFEIGTFLGTNTLNFALNIPQYGRVFTLDLAEPDEDTSMIDLPAAKGHLAATVMDWEGHEAANNITSLRGNSRYFDFSQWRNSVDFVFVDGAHDEEAMRSDTRNALLMARKSRSCIMWHDYGNPACPAVTKVLDEMAETEELFSIEDTQLCMLLRGIEVAG